MLAAQRKDGDGVLGSPYLALSSATRRDDRGPRVPRRGRARGPLRKGDLVRVEGRVERFRDELELEVRA